MVDCSYLSLAFDDFLDYFSQDLKLILSDSYSCFKSLYFLDILLSSSTSCFICLVYYLSCFKKAYSLSLMLAFH